MEFLTLIFAGLSMIFGFPAFCSAIAEPAFLKTKNVERVKDRIYYVTIRIHPKQTAINFTGIRAKNCKICRKGAPSFYPFFDNFEIPSASDFSDFEQIDLLVESKNPNVELSFWMMSSKSSNLSKITLTRSWYLRSAKIQIKTMNN